MQKEKFFLKSDQIGQFVTAIHHVQARQVHLVVTISHFTISADYIDTS